MSKPSELLLNNRLWAAKIKQQNPDFFTQLSQQQSPEYLWIGCADSRVPANQIIDMLPGRVFVHRNIANVVVHTDFNCLSVIQYAVEVLKIKNIIVCGHYGCGGIRAALENQSHGLIDNWLGHIRDIYRYHQDKFAGIEDDGKKHDLLCELNVIEQVANVCNTTIVQNAWREGQELSVHGWIYRLDDGILQDLKVTAAGG
ncbi:MAG: carbonate dehydratase [Gammaproteobacteria bacterium]|nr:carbonate dehydratase [Gammaproteobacteria bacterium]